MHIDAGQRSGENKVFVMDSLNYFLIAVSIKWNKTPHSELSDSRIQRAC